MILKKKTGKKKSRPEERPFMMFVDWINPSIFFCATRPELIH
jgi:hypothetical protein